MTLPKLTPLQFQQFRDHFRVEAGAPLTIGALAEEKRFTPAVTSAYHKATGQVVLWRRDIVALKRAAQGLFATAASESDAITLAHSKSADLTKRSGSNVFADYLVMKTATEDQITVFVRGALNSQWDNIAEIARALRGQIAVNYSIDFNLTMEINQRVASALFALLTKLFPLPTQHQIRSAWLKEVILFADAGHAQRMLKYNKDDWGRWRHAGDWRRLLPARFDNARPITARDEIRSIDLSSTKSICEALLSFRKPADPSNLEIDRRLLPELRAWVNKKYEKNFPEALAVHRRIAEAMFELYNDSSRFT